MITFGVAPGLILYELIKDTLGEPLAFTALLIPLCSAIRLAKFNLDKRQTSSFIGLPTPIAAIFIASLIFSHIFWCDYILYFSFILPLLLVSNISFFSLKFNNQENYEYLEYIGDRILDSSWQIIDYVTFKIGVDKMSIPYLDGATLDWQQHGINEEFIFINPNEQSKCGCGVSAYF